MAHGSSMRFLRLRSTRRSVVLFSTLSFLLVGPSLILAGPTRLQERKAPVRSEYTVTQQQLFEDPSLVEATSTNKLDSDRACTPGNIILDGGFEAATGNPLNSPNWVETSTNFGSPLCTNALCGTGGGAAPPRTGLVWSWFGGIAAVETATISQALVFPGPEATSVVLNFWMRVGTVNSPFTDVLNVRVDGVIQQTFTEPAVAEGAYTLRSINLAAFADNASHTILFEYIGPTSGQSSYVVDDVTLDVVCGSGQVLAKDSIGAVSSGCFFLRNSNDFGVANTVACFGMSSQVPLSGDYDNDGDDTVGTYDTATGTFFLRNSNTPGIADITVQFGAIGATSIPIIGDWDGNGTDTIGIYDNVTGVFFLRNSNSAGGADATVSFGVGGPNVFPVVGDWDGNGTDTVGLYNNSNCVIFLRNANTTGGADIVFCFGPAGASFRPIAGDWDNNNTFGIGIYDTSNGACFLRNSLTNGPADHTFSFGAAGFTPVAGDWDNLP